MMMKPILVVDNDTLLAETVSQLLETNGYATTTAGSGEEAFSLLEVRRFDLVLCDIHMGAKDGFAVLAACKARHPQTKVIICSGDVVYETVSLAFKCGAVSFLAKPFLKRELLHQVGRCFAQTQEENPWKTAQLTQVVGRQGCFG